MTASTCHSEAPLRRRGNLFGLTASTCHSEAPLRRRGNLFGLTAVIVLAFLLSGCRKTDSTSVGQPGLRIASENLSGAPAFIGGMNINNIDLSGESEINLPGITPPAISFGNQGDSGNQGDQGLRVITGRLIPVADKEGKTLVGWRIVGEIYNGGRQVFDNGQVMIGVGEDERVLLAEPVQTGGFLPVASKERMAYDVLIGEPLQSENITVGVREVDEANSYIRIEVENLKFKRVAYNIYNDYKNYKSYIVKPVFAQEASDSAFPEGDLDSPPPAPETTDRFTVSGTIRNTSGKPVTGLIVRFWVVSSAESQTIQADQREALEEVIAVGSWQAAQDVLAAGQSREFSAEVNALTGADKEKLSAGEGLGLSAAAAARPL